MQDGLRRMVRGAGGRLLLPHADERELPAAGDAGRRGGRTIIKGMYLLKQAGCAKAKAPRVQLLGSGTILREVIAAAELLKNDWGVAADIWSCPSFTELARDGRRSSAGTLLHPTDEAAASRTSSSCLEGRAGPGDRVDRLHARSSPSRSAPSCRGRYIVLGTDGFGRTDTREKLRQFFEVDRHYVDGRGAEGAGRRRHDAGSQGGRGDQEIRHRPGEARRRGRFDACRLLRSPMTL